MDIGMSLSHMVDTPHCSDASDFSSLKSDLLSRFVNIGELFMDSIVPFYHMMYDEVYPLLLDQRIKFVPVFDGYNMLNFYHWLFWPFSDRTVRA
jgi:hypothetical protein